MTHESTPARRRARRGATFWCCVLAFVPTVALAYLVAAADDRNSTKRTHSEGSVAKARRASATEPRQQLASLPPEELAELKRRWGQFGTLPTAEQRRLRRLHSELEQAPDGQVLLLTLERYYEWLKGLPSYARAELRQLPPEQRIKRIKQIQAEQRKAEANRLSPEDAKGLMRWMEQLAIKNGAEIMRRIPEGARRRLEVADESVRRRALVWLLFMKWQSPGAHRRSLVSEDDADQLANHLTPETAAQLNALAPPERLRRVANWIRHTLHDHWQSGKTLGLPVDDEELIEFFENELSRPQQEHLLALPGDEMQRELRRAYFASKTKRLDELRKRTDRGKRFPPPGANSTPRRRPMRRSFPDNGGFRPHEAPPR